MLYLEFLYLFFELVAKRLISTSWCWWKYLEKLTNFYFVFWSLHSFSHFLTWKIIAFYTMWNVYIKRLLERQHKFHRNLILFFHSLENWQLFISFFSLFLFFLHCSMNVREIIYQEVTDERRKVEWTQT